MTAMATPMVRSVLVLGSGPIVIGQAAEFDYAGTQACRALREEGVRTILLNSNPATIMTDPGVADVVYLEPLTAEIAERILAREQPDGILAGLGGQTGLNLAMELARNGALERTATKLLGTPLEAIEMAEDRERFRDLLDRIGQPYAPSFIVEGKTDEERVAGTDEALRTIGLPAVVRPAFTLGGTGGGIVQTEVDYRERVRTGLRLSPIHQVMVERCLVGWQEIEYEVMRCRRHLHRGVLDGERRSAGCPHGRLDRGGAGPDPARPGPPAPALGRTGHHPCARRRGRL